MPVLRSHPQSCVRMKKAHKQSHHRHAERSDIPCATVYGLLRALPGDRALLPPSLRRTIPPNLTPASGRQDHTTSPSASASFVFEASSVHRIPHSTFVTIAKRPSYRARDAQTGSGDLPDGPSGIFFYGGLDSNSTDLPVGQISSRHAFV